MEAGNTKPKKQAISWHAAPTKKGKTDQKQLVFVSIKKNKYNL